MTDDQGSRKDDIKKGLGRGLAQLKSLRNEIRGKLQQAGRGAKEQWEEIEPSLLDLEDKLGKQFERTGSVVAETSKALVEELGEAFRRVRDRVKDAPPAPPDPDAVDLPDESADEADAPSSAPTDDDE